MDVTIDREELRNLVSEVLDVEVDEVGDETHFIDDLEVDSLMALEVMVVLERKFGVKLTEDELKEITTLNKAHALMTHKLGEK
ncbi:acyl carrier protein [Haloglycomyces albus]|uniref:acyl carrier protein n=1 Tax=Haloglycomyces albus TaxID=526067 RepID=UPI00046CE401|nr:acyl carrier protein [Haloglycomyces albus]